MVLLFGITHSTRLAIVLTTMEALGLVLVIYTDILCLHRLRGDSEAL
ncbi:hypothetical protein [Methanothrix sp.]